MRNELLPDLQERVKMALSKTLIDGRLHPVFNLIQEWAKRELPKRILKSNTMLDLTESPLFDRL